MNDYIKVEHLFKKFKTDTTINNILQDISFNVKQGEFLILNGESGSGKSTLLNILAGFEDSDSGNIFIENINLNNLSEKEKLNYRKENIGFIFQDFNLIDGLTVLENVMIPLLIKNMDYKKAKQLAINMISYVNLEKKINHKTYQLSGGENQRIGIARALVKNPKIIFADEPTGNLDSKNRKDILDLIKKINLEFKTTVIMVTHSLDELKYADRIIKIVDGRII